MTGALLLFPHDIQGVESRTHEKANKASLNAIQTHTTTKKYSGILCAPGLDNTIRVAAITSSTERLLQNRA